MLFAACRPQSRQTRFVQDRHLQQYDSLILVSGISCSGCIGDFFKARSASANSTLVFDTTYETDFMLSMRKFPHRHVPQQVLDECFDNFGNVIILARTDTGYVQIDYENLNIAP
jgi:hypothetical protein